MNIDESCLFWGGSLFFDFFTGKNRKRAHRTSLKKLRERKTLKGDGNENARKQEL